MHETLVDVGIIVFIIYALISMAYLVTAWRTSIAARDFLKNTQGNLNGSLIELQGTLQNLKKITSDIGTATDDVRRITDTVSNIEKNIRYLYQYFRYRLAMNAGANLAGLQAGVKTGFATLVKTLKKGRSDNHEGRAA